eukprot:11793664-Karenia_brevis.AAC.1
MSRVEAQGLVDRVLSDVTHLLHSVFAKHKLVRHRSFRSSRHPCSQIQSSPVLHRVRWLARKVEKAYQAA